MLAIALRIEVDPGHRDELVAALMADAEGSNRDEPGTLRFDVIQDQANPSIIYIYEAYVDEDAFEVHRQGPWYKLGKDALTSLGERGVLSWSRVFRGSSLSPVPSRQVG
jgi:quinol monooxygenase YgiN